MTTVDVVYRYGKNPADASVLALGRVREVYGVRRMELREAEKTIVVEYDSTRLTEQTIFNLLRRTGLDVLERVVQWTPPVPAEPAPAV